MKIDSIASLAKFILSPDCKSIGILTGAGVSVASGIPDFRSPGGMYDTLQPALITATPMQRELMKRDPTYVVTWELFQQNQFPYMEVRRPFILGTQKQQWKATIAHRFMELLEIKTSRGYDDKDDDSMSKLTRIYTQNIDGLDHQCDKIPKEKIINVHGSLSRAACEGCGHPMCIQEFCQQVQANIKDIYHLGDPTSPSESTPILCTKCQQPLVKPTTVLFGRNLPSDFFDCIQRDLPTMDLLIVAGTSLVVSPANSLVYQCPESTFRVVVNQEPVGEDLGIIYDAFDMDDDNTQRDFFAQGNCEDVFLELLAELGWLKDLNENIELLPPHSARLLIS